MFPYTRRRLASFAITVLAMSLGVPATAAEATTTATKAAPQQLTTPWTKDVTPENALPEYPRPQMTRTRWQNLNGLWQFATARAGEQPPFGKDLSERVLVPYPVESMLSRINRQVDRMWYRRTFTRPPNWNGQRLMLHFGAVDYDARVYVNGRQVATHRGGYDAFAADVTAALKPTGPQELIVGVEDPTDIAAQAVGKQRPNPGGIFYTPASGIWQTVWMEPVAAARIDRIDSTPDLDAKALRLTARASGTGASHTVEAIAYAGDTQVGRVTGKPGEELKLPVPNPKLWSPGDPYLYRLTVRLRSGGRVNDTVGSYFGMRSIKLGKGADGKVRMLLNGKFVMQVGTLDQGYWPDGIYTAPTDEGLRFDLAEHKRLGFNMVRKHVKVEPDRWYYWADRLGLIVWQDMPSTFGGHTPPTPVKQQFETELRELVDQHRSHPSITMWVPFNEGWGEYEPKRIADQVKAWDPSRLVNANSGVNCCDSLPDGGEGDIYDDHNYVGPGSPMQRGNRAFVDGEYGGLGLKVDGHMYDPEKAFAYEMTPDKATLTRRYSELQSKLEQVVKRCGVSGSVYTQITDVENEVNGVYTYDRQVLKPDPDAVRQANQKVIDAGGQVGRLRVKPGKAGLDGVSFYPLDEGSGTVAKDTIGGSDATLKNGAAWTGGHSGSALQLNGSSQFAETAKPVLDTTGSYTASAWVKLDRTGSFATAVSQDGPSHSSFFLQYSGADNRFAFSFAGVRALAPDAPETGKWYHLAGVRDAADGSLTLYVDGKKTGTASACLGDATTGNTLIGRGKYGGNQVDFWPGALDKVRLFDRALSAEEVAQLYGSGGK